MSSRGWWLAVIGIALSAVGLASPAGAAETTFTDTCADVYGKRAIGDLEKTTDPVPGSPVTSGDQVSVTLEWPTFAVAGNRAHRVMECLSIDGGAPRLWAERQFTSASGTVSLTATVPTGLAPKSTVCSQSYLKTQGSFGPVTRRSEKTCYPVGKEGTFSALARSPSPSPPAASPSPSPDNRSTPTTRAPLFSPPATSPPSSSSSPEDYQPPWPPWEKTPKVSASPPPTSATTVPLRSTPTRKSSGAQETAATAPTSTRAPSSSTLPRTGAGVIVLLGISAVALFSGRTLRRASYVIEDNLPVPAVPVDDDDDPTLILGRRW